MIILTTQGGGEVQNWGKHYYVIYACSLIGLLVLVTNESLLHYCLFLMSTIVSLVLCNELLQFLQPDIFSLYISLYIIIPYVLWFRIHKIELLSDLNILLYSK